MQPSRSPVRLLRGGTLNQVITVDGGGHHGLGQARGDELQHGHLCSGILHGHTICMQQATGTGLARKDGSLLVMMVARLNKHIMLHAPAHAACIRLTRAQAQVARATLDVLVRGVVQMAIDNLERTVRAGGRQMPTQLVVLGGWPMWAVDGNTKQALACAGK